MSFFPLTCLINIHTHNIICLYICFVFKVGIGRYCVKEWVYCQSPKPKSLDICFSFLIPLLSPLSQFLDFKILKRSLSPI